LGGADIGFRIFLVSFVALHVIVIIIKIILDRKKNSDNKWSIADLLLLGIICVTFLIFSDYYMDFMWWFTNKVSL
jgi:hypothetical protein